MLTPVVGCCVRRKIDGADAGIGFVHERREGRLGVRWLRDEVIEWCEQGDLRVGFMPGMDVEEMPVRAHRPSLGQGVVVSTRTLGGREQVLVDFPASGSRHWLPYERLRKVSGVAGRFRNGEIDAAERFRLRCLAHAIDRWNENTGALSRLEIDPLPHQIHLVHHILASGHLNWMIADDVGLGKTIEVGMLLAALHQRKRARRVLLITPAGLVRQWQEELYHKLGLDDFEIYGTDFRVDSPRKWLQHPRVIGSLDLFKAEGHLENVLQAPPWDLVIFDEAHRLGRDLRGSHYVANERFRLAARLRRRTDGMLLLTATPHQGKSDRFKALLELMQPDRKEDIQRLEVQPDILRDMVIRNNKADVTDAHGSFIFQGKTTRAVQVPLGEEDRAFDEALKRYLDEGYRTADIVLGSDSTSRWGMAIGFVMTVYRKLAASSVAAIERALRGRLSRITEGVEANDEGAAGEDEAPDERFSGEFEEAMKTARRAFFQGECDMIADVLESAARLRQTDRKLRAFLDDLVAPVLAEDVDARMLVFTEYRATQDYLRAALAERYGDDAVVMIHGGMGYVERIEAIAAFEDRARFLLSTEAGGEGINLQRRCHVMVNYDLPWNPMRLVQRVGRLYRYGQKNRVIVFNLHAPQTLDANILSIMYERLGQVVADMATVGDEFSAGLEEDILGEVVELLDVTSILRDARTTGVARTTRRIDEALEKARAAADLQREIFSHAAGYDAHETRDELRPDRRHVRAFVEGMLTLLGVSYETTHKETVLELRLSESMVEDLGYRGARLRVTFDRDLAARRSDIQMLDFASPFFLYLVRRARERAFGGQVSALRALSGCALVTANLRWQDDRGVRQRDEYAAVLVEADGRAVMNPPELLEWLSRPADTASLTPIPDVAKRQLALANRALDHRLGAASSVDVHPESIDLVSAAWCVSD